MARVRYQSDGGHSGSVTHNATGEIFHGSLPDSGRRVQDEGPGWHQDQYFRTYKVRRTGGYLTGATPQWTFDKMPVTRYEFGIQPELDWDVHPANSVLAARVLEKGNPSQPRIDLPAFAGQLWEIPKLLRVAGYDLLRKKNRPLPAFGSTWLNFQFGWGPLISDLISIIDFQAEAERRIKQLTQLATKGKIVRAMKLDERQTEVVTRHTLHTAHQAWVDADELVQYRSRMWGYSTWYTDFDSPLLNRSSDNIRRLAYRAIYGLHVHPASAWEVIPWSWLVDWFSNIGSLINSTRNIVGASHGPVYLCRQQGARMSNANVWQNRDSFQYIPYQVDVESKMRFPQSADLTFYLPILNGNQWSILGAIIGKYG